MKYLKILSNKSIKSKMKQFFAVVRLIKSNYRFGDRRISSFEQQRPIFGTTVQSTVSILSNPPPPPSEFYFFIIRLNEH